MTPEPRGNPSAHPTGQASNPEVDPEEEYRQLATLSERYRYEISAIEEQRQLVANLLEEYRGTREALEALRDANKGDEMLVPIGSGNFVRAHVDDPGKILASLGSRVHSEDTLDVALARLQERMAGTEGASKRLTDESMRLSTDYQKVAERLQALTQGLGMGGM